jgi:O-antigen/teichoic acid export membrane protein
MATLTSFILSAINSMAGPKFADLFHGGKMEELFILVRKSARLIFWTTIPMLIFLVVFGQMVLSFLFGAEYKAAYGTMLIVMFGQFVNCVSGSTGIFMNMTGQQKYLLFIMIAAAIINVVLNLTLTPSYGIMGAGTAAMVSVSFWNICALYFIKSKYGIFVGYLPWFGGRHIKT